MFLRQARRVCHGSGLCPCSPSRSSRCCWLQSALSYRAPSSSMVSAAHAGFFLTSREGKCTRLVFACPQTYTEFEHQNALSSSKTAGSAKRHGALHVVPHEKCKGCGFLCTLLGVSCFVDSRNPKLPSSRSGSAGTFRWSMHRARAGCPARCKHASVALPIHHFLPDSSEHSTAPYIPVNTMQDPTTLPRAARELGRTLTLPGRILPQQGLNAVQGKQCGSCFVLECTNHSTKEIPWLHKLHWFPPPGLSERFDAAEPSS